MDFELHGELLLVATSVAMSGVMNDASIFSLSITHDLHSRAFSHRSFHVHDREAHRCTL